jgi:hypothetical protein
MGSQMRSGQFEWMLDSEGKLRSPTTWNKDRVEEEAPELWRICFIFRARADLLVVTTSMAVWVELKVESKTPTVRGDTYHQKATQRDIAELAPMIMSGLGGLEHFNLHIQRRPSKEPSVTTWADIVVSDLPHWESSRLLFRTRRGT